MRTAKPTPRAPFTWAPFFQTPLSGSWIDVQSAKAKSRGAVDLCIGSHDESPPIAFRKALLQAAQGDACGYPDLRGSARLREAVAQLYQRRGDPSIDSASGVLVTA